MNRPNQNPDNAWQIQTLADSARQLAERGELQEAEKVYLTIIAAAPYHVRALNFLAVQSMLRGELDKSRDYLQQALRAAPDRAVLHVNMGLILRQQGHLEPALEWLERAIALRPDHRAAWLHKGTVLEALGRRDEAITAYWRGWQQFPGPEDVANDQFTPPALRELLVQAAEGLRYAQLQAFEEQLAPLRAQHGDAALARVQQAAEIYVGARPPRHLHALQRPAFLYLPGVPPQAFFDRAQFPETRLLEDSVAPIREEYLAALQQGEGLAPYVRVPAGKDPAQWRELADSRAWTTLQFMRGGERFEANLGRCPKTAALLAQLPLPEIPGHAPEALFSILQPGAHIPPHFGLGNYKTVVHLPLVIPPDCSIRVGNDTRSWVEDECLIFDDSFQHEAWNRSDRDRGVLILELWNPAVTPAEREGITALVTAINAFKAKHETAA